MALKIGFVNFNEVGLKPLSDAFGKKGLAVAQIKAPNIAKREAGQQVKRAQLIFETGQKLELAIKASGSIFQAKLNGKALPVRNDKDMDAAFESIAEMVKSNEERYLKGRDARLEKAAKAAVKEVQGKNASTSLKKQLEEFTADLAEKNSALDGARNAMTEAQSELEARQKVLADLEAQLAELTTTRDNLIAEIAALKEAA